MFSLADSVNAQYEAMLKISEKEAQVYLFLTYFVIFLVAETNVVLCVYLPQLVTFLSQFTYVHTKKQQMRVVANHTTWVIFCVLCLTFPGICLSKNNFFGRTGLISSSLILIICHALTGPLWRFFIHSCRASEKNYELWNSSIGLSSMFFFMALLLCSVAPMIALWCLLATVLCTIADRVFLARFSAGTKLNYTSAAIVEHGNNILNYMFLAYAVFFFSFSPSPSIGNRLVCFFKFISSGQQIRNMLTRFQHLIT